MYWEHVWDWANKDQRTLEPPIHQDELKSQPRLPLSVSQTLNTTCWQMAFIMSTHRQPPTNIWMNSCRESERYKGKGREGYARSQPAKVSECGTKGSLMTFYSSPSSTLTVFKGKEKKKDGNTGSFPVCLHACLNVRGWGSKHKLSPRFQTLRSVLVLQNKNCCLTPD